MPLDIDLLTLKESLMYVDCLMLQKIPQQCIGKLFIRSMAPLLSR